MKRKPSIFSKDYEKKMRKRKVKIFIIFVVCLVFIILIGIYLTGTFKTVLNDMGKKKQNPVTQNQKINSTPAKTESTKNKNSSANGKHQYTVQLSSGQNVNLLYENKNNSKKFSGIGPNNADIPYSISPSGKNIVIFDSKTQSILLFDLDGNKQDITNPKYVSSTGSVISKSSQLSSNPNYIWCSSPKFIDDNNVAYISQLPWLSKTSEYIWIANITNKSHAMVQSAEGKSIKFGDTSDKGLSVTIDGKTVYLKASGEISQ